MDSAAIAQEFSIPVVKLINDFKAVALGIEVLQPDDLVTLQQGKPRAMGNAGCAWRRYRHGRGVAHMARTAAIYPASEAGHMDFAPADELQDRLLQYLRKKFGHVSVERILSGPGLTNIFNFLQSDLNSDPGAGLQQYG